MWSLTRSGRLLPFDSVRCSCFGCCTCLVYSTGYGDEGRLVAPGVGLVAPFDSGCIALSVVLLTFLVGILKHLVDGSTKHDESENNKTRKGRNDMGASVKRTALGILDTARNIGCAVSSGLAQARRDEDDSISLYRRAHSQAARPPQTRQWPRTPSFVSSARQVRRCPPASATSGACPRSFATADVVRAGCCRRCCRQLPWPLPWQLSAADRAVRCEPAGPTHAARH
jgi:hypothetical protein